jgi:hypothetical protein
MALTDRTPFRIARRFWHGWTQAMPIHLVLAAVFTFAFTPIALTPLVDEKGLMPNHVMVAFAASILLVFLSWAVSGHSMRTGYSLGQTLRAALPLVGRTLMAALVFSLALGAPLVQNTANQAGIGLAFAAAGVAFGFFVYLEWSMMERGAPKPTVSTDVPVWKAIPLALWNDVVRSARFVRGVWRRTPLALGSVAACLFALSLLLLPVTALLSLIWPMPPVWAGVFFSFVLFSAIPSVAAAALAVARTPTEKVA